MGFIFELAVAQNTAYHVPEGMIYVLPSKSEKVKIKGIVEEFSDSEKVFETKFAKEFLLRIMF